MKAINSGEPATPPNPSTLPVHLRISMGLFLLVGVATYCALSFGLAKLVVGSFCAGVLYAGWLVVRKPGRPRGRFAELEDLPADMVLPAGTEERSDDFGGPKIETATRARIMDELVWGKTDSETMAVAIAMAGPGGNAIPRYIELRAAQLSGNQNPPVSASNGGMLSAQGLIHEGPG